MPTLKLFPRAWTLFLFTAYLSGGFAERLSLSSLDDFQKTTVEAFRILIEETYPRVAYLHDDAYLLRFLAVKEFNLQEAADYLKENLAWRAAERIDSILDEDWSDYERRFPYILSNFTKDGRPILYQPLGSWDVSTEVDSAVNFARLVRYASAKMLEDADRKVRASRKNRDVAQFDMVINLEGYAMETHGCVQCLQLSKEILQQSEAHYSGAAVNTYFINAPAVFENVFPFLARAFLEERSRNAMQFLGVRDAEEL